MFERKERHRHRQWSNTSNYHGNTGKKIMPQGRISLKRWFSLMRSAVLWASQFWLILKGEGGAQSFSSLKPGEVNRSSPLLADGGVERGYLPLYFSKGYTLHSWVHLAVTHLSHSLFCCFLKKLKLTPAEKDTFPKFANICISGVGNARHFWESHSLVGQRHPSPLWNNNFSKWEKVLCRASAILVTVRFSIKQDQEIKWLIWKHKFANVE